MTKGRVNSLSCSSVGSCVFARWTNGLYYTGVIDSATDTTFHVLYDDGDEITLEKSDPKAIVMNTVPKPSAVTVGTEVIAFWPNRVRYYPGYVGEIKGDEYYILYDDGDEGWARLDQLRVHEEFATLWCPSVGSSVFARWTNGLYYTGVIDSATDTTFHVLYDDGDEITLEKSDPKAIVMNTVPKPSAVTVGTEVIAFWPNRVRYYPGYVGEIKGDEYYILYDDGDEGWARLDQLRVYSS